MKHCVVCNNKHNLGHIHDFYYLTYDDFEVYLYESDLEFVGKCTLKRKAVSVSVWFATAPLQEIAVHEIVHAVSLAYAKRFDTIHISSCGNEFLLGIN